VDPEVGGSSPPSCTIQGAVVSILTCFKTYDVRGRVGFDLTEEISYRIGRAFAQHLKARRIAIGSDVRLSSPSLKAALIDGILDAGSDAIDIGLAGTEEVYFASFHWDIDGAVEITASHNPADYNGMKFVGAAGRPIGIDDEFAAIKQLATEAKFIQASPRGKLSSKSIIEPYVEHLIGCIDLALLAPMKILVDAGNGAAGHVIDALEQRFKARSVPVTFIKINHQPDGSFPNGVPNPLLPEKRSITSQAVRHHAADLGIAWDGDFDRCFLFDQNGEYIAGSYMAGLLTKILLAKNPNSTFVIDPRLNWNTRDILKNSAAKFVSSRTGHTFFKQIMRQEKADYGGEISAHHYFKNFAYCDSGMIPWLLVIEYLSTSEQKLHAIVAARKLLFPCSDEINFKAKNVAGAIGRVRQHYTAHARSIEETDGISVELQDCRFNLRGSNTEALLRLNVETRANPKLLDQMIGEIGRLIDGALLPDAEQVVR
jgi:phosphomannomutase